MALDGITVACLTHDINTKLSGGRISRIAQTESDELLLTVKGKDGQYRLLMSANASLPLLYITEKNKQSPAQAPGFCMLLRKHIGNGRISEVTQPGLERVVRIKVEHLNEMGDPAVKYLIIELMGKYSNIIFTDENDMILDSIKHISGNISSVREVLPGRTYFIPDTQHKLDPLGISELDFFNIIETKPLPAAKALTSSLTGISPLMGQELSERAGIDGDRPINTLSVDNKRRLYDAFAACMADIKEHRFAPCMIYRKGEPVEYAAFPLAVFADCEIREVPSVSAAMESFYAEKNVITRVRQKSQDLRKILTTVLERDIKKYELQKKQLADTEKRDKYRVRGELIQAFGWQAEPGASRMTAQNYYDNDKEIVIPLDPALTVSENAAKCFEKYNKLKRTNEALSQLVKETADEIEHLRSLQVALDIAQDEGDLAQIKSEMQLAGYVRKRGPQGKGGKQKKEPKSRPLHFLSSDGFHMYVGKNNIQNEELTFSLANGGDWWFHAKGIPGSHVIVKTEGKELPDRVFEEAGALAAAYSSERNADKVEIDYIERKHVKKTPGGKPGFVIYHTNYSLMASPARAKTLQQLD